MNGKISDEKKTNEELKIMEWRFSQFLGEKLTNEQIRSDPENESFQITNSKFSKDGTYCVLSDKGGRIIIFNKNDKQKNKLDYFYEYVAHEKEFDVHKSIEYNEEIRAMEILSLANSYKINLLTAGYRTIKLDKIYKNKLKYFHDEVKQLNQMSDSKINDQELNRLTVPKISKFKSEIKHKTTKIMKCTQCNEINSLSENKINNHNFISSDDNKIYLWDLNVTSQVFNVVDTENTPNNDIAEKITRSVVCEYDPHILIYGTNKGNIKLCDLRTSSDQLTFSKNFYDENSNLNKTIFANTLLSVHDLNMSLSNTYSFASRHYLSVNLWDIRKQNQPNFKILVYEPVINNLSYLYQHNYLNDKFSISTDIDGKNILTGGYNNMFHIIDVKQKLNTQITIDDNEKLINTNVIRKINSKGSCFYKKDDPSYNNINYDKKILHQAFSPVDNFAVMILYNCIYSYVGNYATKDRNSTSSARNI